MTGLFYVVRWNIYSIKHYIRHHIKGFSVDKKKMSSEEFSFIKIIFSSSMEFTGYATKGLQIHEFTKHYVLFSATFIMFFLIRHWSPHIHYSYIYHNTYAPKNQWSSMCNIHYWNKKQWHILINSFKILL